MLRMFRCACAVSPRQSNRFRGIILLTTSPSAFDFRSPLSCLAPAPQHFRCSFFHSCLALSVAPSVAPAFQPFPLSFCPAALS